MASVMDAKMMTATRHPSMTARLRLERCINGLRYPASLRPDIGRRVASAASFRYTRVHERRVNNSCVAVVTRCAGPRQPPFGANGLGHGRKDDDGNQTSQHDRTLEVRALHQWSTLSRVAPPRYRAPGRQCGFVSLHARP